jgi:hypothetical protein
MPPEQDDLCQLLPSYGSVKSEDASVKPPSPPRTPSTYTEHKKRMVPVLIKTQSSFWQDAQTLAHGSIPHSMVLATAIGVVCGVAAYLYYTILEASLDYLWHDLPNKYVIGHWAPEHYWLWIPLVGFTMALGVGCTVQFMGEPGDLAYTIKCVHNHAYVAMSHVVPMVCASQCSILAGGSLGPEAPLVAICAALGGMISKRVFGVEKRNLIRKHTLMGMVSLY